MCAEMLCFGSTCCFFFLMIDRSKKIKIKEICPSLNKFQWISVMNILSLFFLASKRSKLYNNQSWIRQCGMFWFRFIYLKLIYYHYCYYYLDDSSNTSITISSSWIRKSTKKKDLWNNSNKTLSFRFMNYAIILLIVI